MASQASKYLRILIPLFLLSAPAWALGSYDSELNDAIFKKDWPSVVLLLQPKKGQNFEHDLVLAKALLSLERRQEALKLLASLQETRRDERVTKLFQSAGSIFFAQETSTLYYEALELIKDLKFPDAKERLEQALVKEPGQVLLLTRLIQMQLALGQRDPAAANLKIAQASTPSSNDLRLFAAKLAVDKTVSEDENEDELFRELAPYKALLLENEITLTYWAESLKRAQKTQDLEAFAQKTLKDHPLWTFALQWFRQYAKPSKTLDEKLKAQIEKNLKDPAAFASTLEAEMKKTNYLWMGYVNYDTLVVQMKPTPTPTP
jgi:hypothetical protein